MSHEDLAKVLELQEVIDRQAREQSQMKERLASLSSHAAELEEDLDTARKDLIKSEEMNTKLQRDVREVSVGYTLDFLLPLSFALTYRDLWDTDCVSFPPALLSCGVHMPPLLLAATVFFLVFCSF